MFYYHMIVKIGEKTRSPFNLVSAWVIAGKINLNKIDFKVISKILNRT